MSPVVFALYISATCDAANAYETTVEREIVCVLSASARWLNGTISSCALSRVSPTMTNTTGFLTTKSDVEVFISDTSFAITSSPVVSLSTRISSTLGWFCTSNVYLSEAGFHHLDRDLEWSQSKLFV